MKKDPQYKEELQRIVDGFTDEINHLSSHSRNMVLRLNNGVVPTKRVATHNLSMDVQQYLVVHNSASRILEEVQTDRVLSLRTHQGACEYIESVLLPLYQGLVTNWGSTPSRALYVSEYSRVLNILKEELLRVDFSY